MHFILLHWKMPVMKPVCGASIVWPKKIRALDPRLSVCDHAQAGLREDDGQGSCSLLNARKRTVRHKSAAKGSRKNNGQFSHPIFRHLELIFTSKILNVGFATPAGLLLQIGSI